VTYLSVTIRIVPIWSYSTQLLLIL